MERREPVAGLLVQGERLEVLVGRHQPDTIDAELLQRRRGCVEQLPPDAPAPRSAIHDQRPDLCAVVRPELPAEQPHTLHANERHERVAIKGIHELAAARLHAPAELAIEKCLGPAEIGGWLERPDLGPIAQAGGNCQNPVP